MYYTVYIITLHSIDYTFVNAKVLVVTAILTFLELASNLCGANSTSDVTLSLGRRWTSALIFEYSAECHVLDASVSCYDKITRTVSTLVKA